MDRDRGSVSRSMLRGWLLFTAPFFLHRHPENEIVFKRLKLFIHKLSQTVRCFESFWPHFSPVREVIHTPFYRKLKFRLLLSCPCLLTARFYHQNYAAIGAPSCTNNGCDKKALWAVATPEGPENCSEDYGLAQSPGCQTTLKPLIPWLLIILLVRPHMGVTRPFPVPLHAVAWE